MTSLFELSDPCWWRVVFCRSRLPSLTGALCCRWRLNVSRGHLAMVFTAGALLRRGRGEVGRGWGRWRATGPPVNQAYRTGADPDHLDAVSATRHGPEISAARWGTGPGSLLLTLFVRQITPLGISDQQIFTFMELGEYDSQAWQNIQVH